MAINVDPHVLVEKLPEKVEAIREVWLKKMNTCMEMVDSVAENQGTAQAKADAQSFRNTIEGMQKFIVAFCGEAGEKASETGSLEGFITASKAMLVAAGEEV